jgi:hypothetical protein
LDSDGRPVIDNTKYTPDYNLLTPDDMDELLFSEFELALGEATRTRMLTQFGNYEYYQGRQHMNESGELVFAKDLERPADLDYDPTRYATNYFKAIINRKARWQMGGKHGIRVPSKKRSPLDSQYLDAPRQQVSADGRRQDTRNCCISCGARIRWRINTSRT